MLNVRINVKDSGPVNLPGDLRGVLTDVADDWTREIQQRTRAGRGADNRPMRPRADGSTPTLHDSGRMLSSLQADVGDRGFAIAPTDARNIIIARTHQRTGRRFLGASDEQIEDARRAVVDALQGTP